MLNARTSCLKKRATTHFSVPAKLQGALKGPVLRILYRKVGLCLCRWHFSSSTSSSFKLSLVGHLGASWIDSVDKGRRWSSCLETCACNDFFLDCSLFPAFLRSSFNCRLLVSREGEKPFFFVYWTLSLGGHWLHQHNQLKKDIEVILITTGKPFEFIP
jgi:hypothetical protein